MSGDDLPTENQITAEGSKRPEKTNGKDLCVVDPRGYAISLQMDTWERHITVRHPEIRDMLDLVIATLSSPQVVMEQQQGPGSVWFYYRLTGRSFYRHNDIYLSVVVDLDETAKVGLVKTAHLVREIRKGRVVWMKRN